MKTQRLILALTLFSANCRAEIQGIEFEDGSGNNFLISVVNNTYFMRLDAYGQIKALHPLNR